MDRTGKAHLKRRTSARLLLVGFMTLAITAGSVTAPAAASSAPGDHAATAGSTTCTATRVGFGAASGSCQNPASDVFYRVVGVCWSPNFGAYAVNSPLTSSFDTAFVFCGGIGFDQIIAWDTEVIDTEPDPIPLTPDIRSFTCEYIGSNQFICDLSVTDWDSIRWTVLGTYRPGLDDRLSVQGACSGGSNSRVQVHVDISNEHGTVSTGRTVSCTGQPK